MRTPVLETERLILRPLKVEDAQEVFDNWTSDPDVAKYMVWSTHADVSVTKAWMEELQAELDSDNYEWGFERKNDGKLIGSGSIYYKESTQAYALGYNIMKDCWNQGYTTEAAQVILQFGIDVLGAKKFVAKHAKDNPNSGKVMEKVGFHYVEDGVCDSFDGTKHFESKCYELIV